MLVGFSSICIVGIYVLAKKPSIPCFKNTQVKKRKSLIFENEGDNSLTGNITPEFNSKYETELESYAPED